MYNVQLVIDNEGVSSARFFIDEAKLFTFIVHYSLRLLFSQLCIHLNNFPWQPVQNQSILQ